MRATAAVLELDVSGIFTPGNSPRSMCSLSGCTIGGNIVINNSLDVVTSADVTTSGFVPSVGPFTIFAAVGFGFGTQTVIQLSSVAGDTLNFVFDAPVQGSLAGYTGGPLNTGSQVVSAASPDNPLWYLTSGALTPVSTSATPLPASWGMLMSGLVGIFFAAHRGSKKRSAIAAA
jgi:hypothetical protein